MTTNTNPSVALITGGSRGLGRSMALHLADHGVDVIITYVAAEKEAIEVVDAIRKKGRKAAALRLNVAENKTFAAFAESLKAELGRTFGRTTFDFLVNNAGTGLHAAIKDTTEAQFDEMMNVHLKGPFFLTQTLLGLIADGGRILNVSTGLARFAMPGSSVYAAMKGGLEVLTRYMAVELGARKISVNTVAPGAIETDFRGGAVRDNKEINKHVASITTLGRVGLPDDIGGAVAMLLTPEMHWMTGQRVELSGGMHI